MRTHGTLTKWNDDRGFGFIVPAKGNGDLFVHISAFPRDGVRPRLNELISFEIEVGSDGKRRAVRVMRPGQKSSRPAIAGPTRRRNSSVLGGALTLAAIGGIGGIGGYGYSQYMRRASAIDAPDTEVPSALVAHLRRTLVMGAQCARK